MHITISIAVLAAIFVLVCIEIVKDRKENK